MCLESVSLECECVLSLSLLSVCVLRGCVLNVPVQSSFSDWLDERHPRAPMAAFAPGRRWVVVVLSADEVRSVDKVGWVPCVRVSDERRSLPSVHERLCAICPRHVRAPGGYVLVEWQRLEDPVQSVSGPSICASVEAILRILAVDE